MQGLQSISKELEAANTKVLAINYEDVKKNAAMVQKEQFSFQVLADPDYKAIDAYDLRHQDASIDGSDIARPAVFIIDSQGIVTWSSLTDNWRVRVRPETVLTQLKKLSK